jgi:hypothetical protein
MLHHVTVDSSVHLASFCLQLLGLRLLLQLGDFIKPLLYVRPARMPPYYTAPARITQ